MLTAFQRLTSARLEAILGTIEEASGFLSECDLTPRTRNAVDLAVEELLSHVVKYAYPAGEAGDVALLIERDQHRIRLEIADTGGPFDPTSVPPPPPMSLETPRGGRGLQLVKSLARSLQYRRDGGRNVLVVEFAAP